ncbi:phosphoribosyltransferase domain-containing protein [Moraxella boevrei]|uniref:phosphoribosyltransferase domain-containing protein n=1 Tax=Faucicola boevrei TaxID=346665 RepID=UPI00373589A6
MPNPIQQRIISLSRGTLELTYQTKADYQLDDLLGFAERINPKRAFLFVSKVLGRHIPVAPSQIRQAFRQLAEQIPDGLPEPILVFGMAETAVGLSAGVHQILQQRYPNAILLNSTRHAQDGELLATFSEDHSHASQHLIYQSDNPLIKEQILSAKTLIMVDDEASTGKTCQNLVNALIQAGLNQLQQVHLATLVDWSLGQVGKNPFKNQTFNRHHLLSGQWTWTDKPHDKTIQMPNVATTKAGSQPLLPTGNWGRKPTLNSSEFLPNLLENLYKKLENFDKSQLKNVLVLGSNEFVWLPFLLAERLANDWQINVKFSALTRSPIVIDNQTAIKSVLSFTDNYGLGMTNFVYNVEPDAWDLIVLCIETPSDSVDKIWQDLVEQGKVLVLD